MERKARIRFTYHIHTKNYEYYENKGFIIGSSCCFDVCGYVCVAFVWFGNDDFYNLMKAFASITYNRLHISHKKINVMKKIVLILAFMVLVAGATKDCAAQLSKSYVQYIDTNINTLVLMPGTHALLCSGDRNRIDVSFVQSKDTNELKGLCQLQGNTLTIMHDVGGVFTNIYISSTIFKIVVKQNAWLNVMYDPYNTFAKQEIVVEEGGLLRFDNGYTPAGLDLTVKWHGSVEVNGALKQRRDGEGRISITMEDSSYFSCDTLIADHPKLVLGKGIYGTFAGLSVADSAVLSKEADTADDGLAKAMQRFHYVDVDDTQTVSVFMHFGFQTSYLSKKSMLTPFDIVGGNEVSLGGTWWFAKKNSRWMFGTGLEWSMEALSFRNSVDYVDGDFCFDNNVSAIGKSPCLFTFPMGVPLMAGWRFETAEGSPSVYVGVKPSVLLYRRFTRQEVDAEKMVRHTFNQKADNVNWFRLELIVGTESNHIGAEFFYNVMPLYKSSSAGSGIHQFGLRLKL